MEEIKRIITRAVYGNRTQRFQNIVRIPAREMGKLKDVLGGMINGAKVLNTSIEEADNKGIQVRADVEFEVHIWYWSDNDTKVYKTDVKSSDVIAFEKQRSDRFSHEDVRVWMKEKPRFIGASIIREPEGDVVAVQLEYELEAEIIGEALLNVKVFNNNDAMIVTREAEEESNEAADLPNRAVEMPYITEIKYLQNL